MTSDADAFERAFVALGYSFGRRGAELVAGLDAPGAAATDLVRRLADPERPARARVLAAELAPILVRLEAQELTAW